MRGGSPAAALEGIPVTGGLSRYIMSMSPTHEGGPYYADWGRG